jgi:hypothetical protein
MIIVKEAPRSRTIDAKIYLKKIIVKVAQDQEGNYTMKL